MKQVFLAVALAAAIHSSLHAAGIPLDLPRPDGRNPENYLLVGDAMGWTMVRLEGSQAEDIPKSDREAKAAVKIAVEAAKKSPTQEQITESLAAVRPMIIDDTVAYYQTAGVHDYDWDPERCIPAIGPLSVWLEEQKLPPLAP